VIGTNLFHCDSGLQAGSQLYPVDMNRVIGGNQSARVRNRTATVRNRTGGQRSL